jgi:hypothetical protein
MFFSARNRSTTEPADLTSPSSSGTQCFRILRSEEDLEAARNRMISYERARAAEDAERAERHKKALARAGISLEPPPAGKASA